MTARVVVVVLATSALIACSQDAPSESKPASASQAPSKNSHGLSPDVVEVADELLTYIENNLLESMFTGAAREPLVTEAVGRLGELDALNKSYEDRFVTRLLAMMIGKDNQRAGLLLIRGAGIEADIGHVVSQRDRCHLELMGWLEYSEASTSTLRAGACLKEANKVANRTR